MSTCYLSLIYFMRVMSALGQGLFVSGVYRFHCTLFSFLCMHFHFPNDDDPKYVFLHFYRMGSCVD